MIVQRSAESVELTKKQTELNWDARKQQVNQIHNKKGNEYKHEQSESHVDAEKKAWKKRLLTDS